MKGVLLLTLALVVAAISISFAQQPVTPQQSPTVAAQGQSQAFRSAMQLYRQRRFAQAIDAFQAVVANEPNNAAAFYFMGYAQYVTRHFQESVASFDKAFEIDPNLNPRPYFR